jgi:hypothetical protein
MTVFRPRDTTAAAGCLRKNGSKLPQSKDGRCASASATSREAQGHAAASAWWDEKFVIKYFNIDARSLYL